MAADTKERILDVAERLFADFGFATTSLRDITREAGANLAAVNYHFGSKEALLKAVLTRHLAPLNQRRLERLDALEASCERQSPELEDLLRAFIAPPFEMRAACDKGGRDFVRLLGRVHVETNDEFHKSFMAMFENVFTRFTAAFQRALPEIEPEELSARMWFLIGSMAHTMMWNRTFGPMDSNRNPDEVLESLIQFGAAGLSAPVRHPAGVRAKRVGGHR